jgi:hypothetical protein
MEEVNPIDLELMEIKILNNELKIWTCYECRKEIREKELKEGNNVQ